MDITHLLSAYFFFSLFVVVVVCFLFCFDFSFNIYSCIFLFYPIIYVYFYTLDSLVIFLILREMALYKTSSESE